MIAHFTTTLTAYPHKFGVEFLRRYSWQCLTLHSFSYKYGIYKTIFRQLLLAVFIGCYVSACGILSELPDNLRDYPSDFQQFLNQNKAQKDYEDFVYFLQSYELHKIVPAWQLLQQGSDFRQHSLPKYALPDRKHWNQMVNTLVFLKHDLIPHIGDVRVLSGFRSPQYNQLAGGAEKSRHLTFSALDLRPVAKIDRTKLHRILQNRWHTLGEQYDLGLGLYDSVRFHIDTGGYRQW